VRVEVIFGGANIAPSDVAGRVVAVIDVLRASTSIAAALTNGARAIVPFESSEEAVTRSKAFDKGEFLLAGERRMKAIPGFDLGNSPLEFTREAVEGKTVLMTTTNGTPAITNSAAASEVVVASYVNFTAVLTMLRSAVRGGTAITLVCAGRDRQFGLEDAGCAGRFVRHVARRLTNVALNDAARACALIDRRYGDDIARLFDASEHGQALRAAGYVDDLAACAALDSYPVVPIYQDRQITKLGPERVR
jgi:2-phosphosulfolactate phosphatase